MRPASGSIAILTALGGLVAAMTLAGTAAAEHVEPVFVAGNPTCAGQGYDLGFKVDPPSSGTYEIPGTGGHVTVSNDGTFFGWTSTIGIDGVIAKGGPDANLYRYSPESFGDTGLYAPANASGEPARLSHIEFCIDFGGQPALEVSKTARTSYTRTFSWELTKDVDVDSHSGVAGDSFSSTYTVAVDRTVAETGFAVAGEITITNPSPFAATITSVTDSAGGTPASVECPSFFLPAGGTLVCSYAASLASKTDGTNTVTVATTGLVGGGSATAGYAFGEPTTVVGDASVVANDTNPAGPKNVAVSSDQTFTYSRAFGCPTAAGAYTSGRRTETIQNTATATGPSTNLSASRPVTTRCQLPGTEALPPANVSVLVSPSTPTAAVGDAIGFRITVTNHGTQAASGVTVNGTISQLASLASVTPSQGTCSRTGNAFACLLGSLGGGVSATIDLSGTVIAGGSVLASASVSAENEAENEASAIVLVLAADSSRLPRPRLGRTVNVTPVSGIVLVNGKRLQEGEQIPVGAKVNTSRGVVNLESFNGIARFRNGIFRIVEPRIRGGFTDLKLLGGNFLGGCAHPLRRPNVAEGVATHRKKTVRRLWGNGKGRFRTSGKYSSATVRGTFWVTTDRCDGTLTTVRQGRVVLFDRVLKKRVVLRAGQSYLARPRSAQR